MIASVKQPKDWHLADWISIITIAGIVASAAWWMSAQTSLLTSINNQLTKVVEKQDKLVERQDKRNDAFEYVIRDHEKRLIIIENSK